jgi:hypothetical protein
VVNTANTSGTTQELLGPAVSVFNSETPPVTTGQQTATLSGGSATTTATADSRALGIQVVGLRASGRLVEGQTVTVRAVPTVQVTAFEFTINGVPFDNDSTSPYEFLLTAPSGGGILTLGASARDDAGTLVAATPLTLSVDRDLTATITGRVVDADGLPVKGALVELLSEGLQAEFFDFADALTALPDLSGRTPNRVTRVTAINMRNPNGVFGADPFGAQLAPDYAARFTGWISVEMAGAHTFFLGADEGARLTVGGVTVVDIPTGRNEYQEASATIDLPAGLSPIEVIFYESSGNVELQLSWAPPNQERRVISPFSLVPQTQAPATVTDNTGLFSSSGIPTGLETVRVRAILVQPSGNLDAYSNTFTPAGEVNVGDIVVRQP